MFPSTSAGIQLALDAAGSTQGGEVWIGPGQITGITNLTMYANTTLMGSGMNATELVRSAAATGIAIREKTSGEGNGTSGGTGIWLKDFKLSGNASVGDGINLGNQGGAQLNINAGLENVFVSGFPSGYGMILNGNASYGRQMWANSNQYGFKFSGGGSNKWYSVRAEGNSSNNILVQDADNSFFGIHCEETANAGSSGTIEVSSNNNFFYGVTVTLAFNRTNIIVLKSGSARMTLIQTGLSTAGHTFTNLIYDEAYSRGTGSTNTIVPLWIDNGTFSSYFYNSSTNDLVTLTGGVFPFQALGSGNHPSAASSITIDAGYKFRINGNGTVDTINFTAATDDGREICFLCDAAPTFKDGTGNLYLNGDFVGNVNSTLKLIGDTALSGWAEVSRSANS